MNLTETYVIKNGSGEITDYVFIDPSSKSWKRIPKRYAFDLAVSFSVHRKIDKNYPVVFDDMVTMHGERLLPLHYAAVPPPVKRRLVAWLKVQPGHAAGPGGVPEGVSKARTAKASKTESDDIKEALVRLHPRTRAADWRRRSRKKEADGIHRLFEHVDGRTVMTVEKADGTIDIPEGADDRHG